MDKFHLWIRSPSLSLPDKNITGRSTWDKQYQPDCSETSRGIFNCICNRPPTNIYDSSKVIPLYQNRLEMVCTGEECFQPRREPDSKFCGALTSDGNGGILYFSLMSFFIFNLVLIVKQLFRTLNVDLLPRWSSCPIRCFNNHAPKS